MKLTFQTSGQYWEDRYRSGRNSGDGSYGRLAAFKADVLNRFVEEHGVKSIIEYGCGDGHQLSLSDYPQYLGFDVSPTAIELCRDLFRSDSNKTFSLLDNYCGQKADLTLSLDVIFHLVEDDVFANYMRLIFDSSNLYVAIYSSNDPRMADKNPHVLHRRFTDWVGSNALSFRLYRQVPNAFPFATRPDGALTGQYSPSDFYFYVRQDAV